MLSWASRSRPIHNYWLFKPWARRSRPIHYTDFSNLEWDVQSNTCHYI